MATRDRTMPSGATLTFQDLGLGTGALGNLYRALPEDQAEATFAAAWAHGCRYFDTAPLYGLGLAETRLNHFLRGKPRDEVIVSTKVGRLLTVCSPAERTGIGKFFDCPSRREIFDYSADGVHNSLYASLERLGLDRVDIVFAHDLDLFTHGTPERRDAHLETFLESGLPALAELRRQGVVKAIGAGLNEWETCERLARTGLCDIFLLAGRYTLLEQEALESFLPLAEEKGIAVVIGGAYNSGILATGAVEGATYNYEPAPPHIVEKVRRIEAVCEAHGVAIAEAALRFPLCHPAVATVVPGAAHPDEVERNYRTLGKEIPPALWSDLKAEKLLRDDAPTP